MKLLDFFLTLLLPFLILFHLWVAPYTKVEESFNLQATHDILAYSTPTHDIGPRLRATYDHFEFPGAVPRTFVGAVVLAGISRPILSVLGWQYGQLVIRAVLGLFNAYALLRYKSGVDKAFGRAAGMWYILLQASQFHIIYYASRTLPNMFAFGLSTLALREVLPMPVSPSKGVTDTTTKRHRLAIYLFVLAGVIYRSELALLLATQLFYLLVQPLVSLQTIIPAGISSAAIALAISVPIDSYFWQRLIWPELAGFFYNAIQGKSVEWGTSPFHAYFSNFLPKLLLNPAIPLFLIPWSFFIPSTRRPSLGLVVPSLAFIAIYSLQPHKEARFIIYTVPPLTASAALGANYIFTRRSRSLMNRLLSLAIISSIIGSFVASTIMLGISSLNYPGGEALFRLHEIVANTKTTKGKVYVHMDVLACMTGVSRFQQDFPSPSLSHYVSSLVLPSDNSSSVASKAPSSVLYRYDKTENATTLLDPAFWIQFDYVLAEGPETVIGSWEIVDTVYGYAGIEFLRPGAISMSGVDNIHNAGMVWKAIGGKSEASEVVSEPNSAIGDNFTAFLQGYSQEVNRLGVYGFIREEIRKWITKGWWIGPKMEGKIRILKRKT